MNTTGRKTVKAKATAAKSVKATGTSAVDISPTSASTLAATLGPPSFESIAKRSYEIYLARGAEPGHEVEDWLAAEAELAAKLH